MKQITVCWGTGLVISAIVTWMAINFSHNAAIGSATVLLSLPLLPGSAIYTAITRDYNPGWLMYASMIVAGSVFYSFPVFVVHSVVSGVKGRKNRESKSQ